MGPTLAQETQGSPGAPPTPATPEAPISPGFRSFPNPDPSTFPGPETAALTVALPFTVQHADAPLRRRLARSKTSVMHERASALMHSRLGGPAQVGSKTKQTHPRPQRPGSPPPRAPKPRRCAEARLGAPPAGHAPPAACRPPRLGRTKRAALIGRAAPRSRRLGARAANPCIEMQIRGYKRGGAQAGRGSGEPGLRRTRCEGRGRSCRRPRSGRRGSWLRPWHPAGTEGAERARTPGRLGGTARCRPGPQAGRRAGGPGPGLSCPLPAGPEAPGGEEAARADQREPSGAAAAAGGRRGEPGGRAGAPGLRGRSGGAALPALAPATPRPRRSRPRRCRPSWRTRRCWS